jgi:stalled ribosome alternative rescue factor ArfA
MEGKEQKHKKEIKERKIQTVLQQTLENPD